MEVPDPREKLPPVMRPVLEIEKSVVVEFEVEEPMAKSVVLVEP